MLPSADISPSLTATIAVSFHRDGKWAISAAVWPIYASTLLGCLKHSDVSADGSRFGSGKKADPRERQIDQEFLARNYHRDSTGHFHVQPTPTSSMFPRQLSEQSKHSAEKDEKKPKEKKRFFGSKAQPAALELTPPKLALANSTSAESKETGLSGENDAADSPELLVTPPTA